MGGHKADAVTWSTTARGLLPVSYGSLPFIDDFVKAHPVKSDLGKSWELSLPQSSYLYDQKATGSGPSSGLENLTLFPMF